MKNPHFFKAKSRLGTHNPPYRQDKVNFGVEEGPEAILSSDFVESFVLAGVSTFDFPLPETIDPENLIPAIAIYYQGMKKRINNLLRKGQTQVVIGGDDSVTFPSILASLERVGEEEKFGYIRFDSHGDMNLYKDSPTKNFHGMYMRPLFDGFDIPEINSLVNFKLKPEDSVFIGNLDLDGEEKVFFEEKGILKVDKKSTFDIEKAKKIISNLVNNTNHIHVSIDIDAFDESIAPATGIPAKNGLLKEDVLPLFEIIKKAENLSFDLVEVNPLKNGAGRTIQLAREMIRALL